MTPRYTLSQLEKLKKEGFIKSYSISEEQPAGKKLTGKVQKKDLGAEYKQWMHDTLKAWADEKGYLLIREHTFSEERGWRLDWAVFNGTQKVVGVEYEGIGSKKSRHTTKSGYTEDAQKYSQAALMGWKVLRYTAKNYENLINDLNKI